MNCRTDESVKLGDVGVSYDGKDYPVSGKGATIKGLSPESTITVTPYAFYNGERYNFSERHFTTKSLNLQAETLAVGPTSARLKGSYDKGDAQIASRKWGDIVGDRVEMVGLKPGGSYTFTYTVTTKEPEASFTKSVEVQTPKLQLETLAPKCVNSGCAIVAATTNMDDCEVNGGFQWKKYDAPASLAPSEAYAPVCDGVLEGYLKNLQPTSYYNVRAFYKAADGTYYYGDWVTFDPSDFSFFEPTVRTYPVQETTANTALLRGYALAGTDDITSQGFQYWAKSPSAAPGMRREAPAQGVTTVECSGQVMQIEITDLKPGTDYAFRSFVVTDKGTTYGDEQTFSTEGEPESDIEAVEAEEVTVKAYYNLAGVRLSKPAKGINIVVYSDGTTRKIFVR